MPVTETHRDPYTIVAKAEENSTNWLQRTFGGKATINDTFYYANATPVTPDVNGNVVLKSNILFKFLPLITLVLMAVVMYNVWFNFPHDLIFPGLMIFAIVWSVAAVISVAVSLSKHKSFDITVNKGGIEVGDRYFFWKEIRATFVIDRSQGNNKVRFLVFVLQDDTVVYFHLRGFPTWTGSFKTLCTAIRDFHQPV